MRRPSLVALLLVCWSIGPLSAQAAKDVRPDGAQFLRSLSPRSGAIVIGGGMATLQVPAEFQFLDQTGAHRLLTEAWGNPPDASEGVLGMLVPAGSDIYGDDSWGVVITFDADGYVKDDDAESIDYQELLEQMQHSVVQENEERSRRGYPTVTIVGWAAPPRYDRAAHKLYWAKELQFGGEAHTLNYNVRVLGRRGVLVLNAVGPMTALGSIERSMQAVMGFVAFNEGHRYEDYVHGTDRTATYGIAALVAGGVAAKAGLFKALWIGILALKKVIIVGALALGAAARKFLKGRSARTGAAA